MPPLSTPSNLPPLVIPSQFRAKVRVFVPRHDTPSLVLYHHDMDGEQSREDYYHFEAGKHRRSYTSIKKLGQGVNYMVFHRQPNSPRACFISPSPGPAVDLAALAEARYMGTAVITRRVPKYVDPHTGGGASHERGSPTLAEYHDIVLTNVTCLHYAGYTDGGKTLVDFCIDRVTGYPLVFESAHFRVDVLHFDASVQAQSIYDPQRASEAKCEVVGVAKPKPRRTARPV